MNDVAHQTNSLGLRSTRILVAEDDAIVALDLRATLVGLGHHVADVVRTGADALDAAAANPPDLALLDIRMPGPMDGVDVGEILMRERGIPVIYVTGYGDAVTLSRALEESPYGYVLKPFKEEELHAAIRVALERHSMERKLETSREELSATLRSIGDGVVATDARGRIRYVNPAAVRLTGVDPEVAEGRRVEEVVSFEDGSGTVLGDHPVRAALRERRETRLQEGAFLARRDGVRVPVSDLATPIVMDDGELRGCVLILRDETRVRQREEELARVRQRFLEMTYHIQDVFWITEPDKKAIEYLSPAYETIWGRSREAVYDDPLEWLEAVHPEDREMVRESLPRQEVANHEMDYRIVRPDGEIRWIHDRAFPVRDEDGKLLRVVGVAEDVTDRVQLTRRQAQRQRLEAVGQLAGGVAHDFNNLLTVIQSQTDLVLADLDADGDVAEELGLVRDAARRAKRLTSHLLAFSRQQMLQPEVVHVDDVVRELGGILNRLLGEDIEVELELSPGLPPIEIDVGQLEQAVVNLALNARDAMPGGGSLRISTYQGPADVDADGESGTRTEPREHVFLSVSDTGVGMEEGVRSQVFEPFFTTKGPGQGTGLGLAMVYGLTRQSGGTIALDSAPGEGTTVTLGFPASARPARRERREAPSLEGSAGVEARVLLVEDDPVVRRVVTRILERMGVTVRAEEDAEAAIQALEEGSEIDLLVTDMGLPGMKGPDLIRALRARAPGLPAVAISGYPRGSLEDEYDLPVGVQVLPKPFTPTELMDVVRSTLGSAEA